MTGIVFLQDLPTKYLSPPEIIPLDNILIRDTANLKFQWYSRTNSGSYDLLIQSLDNTTDSLLFNSNDTLFHLPKIPVGHYFWKVRSVKNDLKSKWSIENEFYVNPTLIFSKTYGTDQNEKGMDLIQTQDNGHILVGTTKNKSTKDMDAWIVKVDSSGNLEWDITLDRNLIDEVNAGVIGDIESIYIAGKTGNSEYSKVWLFKIGFNGEIIWENTFYDRGFNWANDIVLADDNHIIITGYTSIKKKDKKETSTSFFMKVNSEGEIIWQREFQNDKHRTSRSILMLPEGRFIVTGSIRSTDSDDSDCWIAKLDSSSNIVWENQIGGPGEDIGHDISPIKGGGFIITGMSKSITEKMSDLWLIKTDDKGQVQWTRTYHESGYHWGNSVYSLKNSDFLVSGYTQTDMFSDLIYFKADADGEIKWKKVLGGDKFDFARVIQPITNGGYIILGTTCFYGAGLCDIWLIKTDHDGRTIEVPNN